MFHYNPLLFLAGAIARRTAFYGEGNRDQAILFERFGCDGTETDLLSCFNEDHTDCTHEDDVGVDCMGGEFQLSGIYAIPSFQERDNLPTKDIPIAVDNFFNSEKRTTSQWRTN